MPRSAGITRIFTISIGKLTIGKGKPRYSYLGVTVPSANHDGTYRRAVDHLGDRREALLAVEPEGAADEQPDSRHRSRAGPWAGAGAVTGSFRCK